MTDIPERWVQLAYDTVEPQEFDTLDQAVEAVLEPVLADLRRQVEALIAEKQRHWGARYEAQVVAFNKVLDLLDTGGLDE